MPKPVLNYAVMEQIFNAPYEYFTQFGQEFYNPNKPEQTYIYDDRGCDILAVAHLDSVNESNHFQRVETAWETRVFSTKVDDRLGVYLLLDLLPKHGIKFDLLLTTGEEKGQSSAGIFTPPEGKSYNWMFEFDRRGTDVVHYRYSGITEHLKAAGYAASEISHGSNSDIDYLSHLGILGANFGTGYYDEHNRWSYFVPEDTIKAVRRFIGFYHKFKKIRLPYVKTFTPSSTPSYGHYITRRFDEDEWEDESKYGDPPVAPPSTGEITCRICEQPYKGSDKFVFWKVCEACTPYAQYCLVCKSAYDTRQWFYGMCEACESDASKGIHALTTKQCPECHCLLFNVEIYKGECKNCHKILSFASL